MGADTRGCEGDLTMSDTSSGKPSPEEIADLLGVPRDATVDLEIAPGVVQTFRVFDLWRDTWFDADGNWLGGELPLPGADMALPAVEGPDGLPDDVYLDLLDAANQMVEAEDLASMPVRALAVAATRAGNVSLEDVQALVTAADEAMAEGVTGLAQAASFLLTGVAEGAEQIGDILLSASATKSYALLAARFRRHPLDAEALRTAADLFRMLGNQEAEVATCLLEQGRVLRSIGEYDQAIAVLDEAESLLIVQGRALDTADSQLIRGEARYESGDPSGALSDLADCLLEHGRALRSIGEYDQAIAVLDEAELLLAAQGRALDTADSQLIRGEARYESGDPSGALSDLAEAERGFRAVGIEVLADRAAYQRGRALHQLGKLKSALKAFNTARVGCAARGDIGGQADADMARARVLFDLDRAGDALRAIDSAQVLYVKAGDEYYVGHCHLVRAYILGGIGRSSEAQRQLTAARRIFAAFGDDASVERCKRFAAQIRRG